MVGLFVTFGTDPPRPPWWRRILWWRHLPRIITSTTDTSFTSRLVRWSWRRWKWV